MKRKMIRNILSVAGVLLLQSCTTASPHHYPTKAKSYKAATHKAAAEAGTYKTNVAASYYHDKFNGRKTASGAIFSNYKLTAAHRSLPFGTEVKVTNRTNGKSVIVTINDRGPFTKDREIDLSKKDFMEISEHKNQGVLQVDIEILK